MFLAVIVLHVLQEKACKRANRIRNNVTDGTIALFVTLTYSNDYVPYVFRDDLYSSEFEVNVFRNASYRFVFDRHSGQVRGKKKKLVFILFLVVGFLRMSVYASPENSLIC